MDARMGQIAGGFDAPGQAEVGDVRFAGFVHQDVRRLQISVENASLVGVVHGEGDRGHQSRRTLEIADELLQHLVQAAAGNQLHAEEALARRLAHLVNGHDVGVVELGDGLGLVLEPRSARPRWPALPSRITLSATSRSSATCRAL